MPVSFGTALLLAIGGFNALAAIVASQACVFPVDITGHDSPLVKVGIIRVFVRFLYRRFFVGTLRAKNAAISTEVIDRISAGPSVGGKFAVFVALRLHSAPPWVCRSMPAFRILSAAAKMRCALRSGIVAPASQL